MMSPTPVRIAVLGLGRMGLLHAESATTSPQTTLVGVADVDTARAAEVAAQHGVQGFGDARSMLDAVDAGAIVIATPAPAHSAVIELAAERGVHVFCEKPLDADGPAAARALQVAADHGIAVQVGFQMRFDDDLARLQRAVASDELGRLYQFRASLRDVAPPPRSYLATSGGYFWDGAIHCFDLARWIMGEVAEVTAFGATLSHPMFEELGDVDNAIIVLRFVSGAIGTIDVSRVAGYGFDSGVEVLGERGAIRVPAGPADGLVRYRDGTVQRGYVQDFMQRFGPTYPRELDAFAATCRTQTAPRPDGHDGLVAMRIAEAATRSWRSGRTVKIGDVGW